METNALSASRIFIISLVLAATSLKAQPGSPATFGGQGVGTSSGPHIQSVRLPSGFHFVLETRSYDGALAGLNGAYCVDPADLEFKTSACPPKCWY